MPHPDYLLPFLSGKQWLDWQRFHSQFNLAIDRKDIYHAMSLCMYHNAHSKESYEPSDFIVYNKPDKLDEPVSQEEFVKRIQSRFGRAK